MSFEMQDLYSHNLGNDDDFEPDILDMDKIHFDNDETWLYSPEEYLKNRKEINALKNINTQTFTRPKKKLQRLSIEKYNEEFFSEDIEKNFSPITESVRSENPTLTKPLNFDLSQLSNSTHYFENLASNSLDTFQNMSPPSLVNSMCSSTFTNLMQSSMIKNDPILKEICDTDFTASILSQCSEPSSLVQSINYTSTIDDFLSSNQCDIDMKCSGDASYINARKENNDGIKMDFDEYHDACSDSNFEQIPLRKTTHKFDGTYRKSNRLSSATFRKTDLNNSTRTLIRNHTYEIDPKDIEKAHNVTLVADKTQTVLLNEKNTTIVKDSCNNELAGYHSKESMDNGKNGSGKSLDCSIGSADSLDRMSTLSSSSKGSSKEAENLTDKPEKQTQVMSTPKPNWTNNVLNRVMWDYDGQGIISPIASGSQSDSGESSDDYKSVKSSFSKNSLESNPAKQTRSLVSLQPQDVRKLKSINTIVNPGNIQKVPTKYHNTGNLPKMGANLAQFRSGSAGSLNTNLNTMKPTLKGSYTSLKPVNSHLPVAPPMIAQGKDSTFSTPTTGSKKIHGVFVKPSGPALRSALPRPTSSTSIPRPVSKIPGPKRW